MIKKVLKNVLLAVVFIVGIPAVLLLLYVLFNLNLFHKTRKLSAAQLDSFVGNLDSNSLDPYKFVADKFNDHSVVFIGENHKRKQDLEFLSKLIPYLYQTKKINIIGWEFGANENQNDADSVVTAREFDRKKAISIMRRSAYYWCWEEYLNIFKTFWELNKNISSTKEKIRFLQLNKPYIPRYWESQNWKTKQQERVRNFDNILPEIVEKEVIEKNKKILIYCGMHHSLTKFKTPKFFFVKDNEGRAGQRLYAKYPDKIFQIDLIAPYPPRWCVYYELRHADINNVYKFVYPFEGVFNQLFDSIKKPFAIDSKNAYFRNIKDYNSFYEFDKWGGVKLKDFCDGAIMLQSFDKIEPVHFIEDWITTEEELNEVKSVLPENHVPRIKTIPDLINYIHPNVDINGVRKFHALKKFW